MHKIQEKNMIRQYIVYVEKTEEAVSFYTRIVSWSGPEIHNVSNMSCVILLNINE